MVGTSDEVLESAIIGGDICDSNSNENRTIYSRPYSGHRSVSVIHQVSKKHFIADFEIDSSDKYSIFRSAFVAPVGRSGILVQLQLDGISLENAQFELVAVNLMSGRVESKIDVDLSNCSSKDLDEIILELNLSYTAPIDVIGRSSVSPSSIRLRHLKVINLIDKDPIFLNTFQDGDVKFSARALKAVFVGSTNICNANCPHCPTNKKMTSHLESGSMSMEIYEKLIRGLSGIDVSDGILFGVFGEPFEDPLLEEKIKFTKSIRPDINIDIASNGILASTDRVYDIIEDIRRLSIHVEAATPELYDKLMSPLKARDVFPHVDNLIRQFGSKIAVTTPLHQANLHEVTRLKRRWSRRGTDVSFLPLQTRTTDRTLAKRVNLAATGGFWDADLVDILVVDWDGVVLATCDDFLRRQPLGNLNVESVKEIMDGQPRRALFEALRSYRWHMLPSIKDAIVDEFEITQEFSAIAPKQERWEIHGEQLAGGPGSHKAAEGITLGAIHSADQALVFGPYLTLPPGRYHASFIGRSDQATKMTRLVFEIASELGARRYAAVERSGNELANFSVSMEFLHDRADSEVEFRIFGLSGDPSMTTLQRVEVIKLSS